MYSLWNVPYRTLLSQRKNISRNRQCYVYMQLALETNPEFLYVVQIALHNFR